jgi:hypothetical protein
MFTTSIYSPSQKFIFIKCGRVGKHEQSRVAQLVYYKNVKSPNLDLKQGISYLEREGAGGRGKREKEGEIDRDREREIKT